jgi:hypothetical protein
MDNPIANKTASDFFPKKASDSFPDLTARHDPARPPANVAARPRRQDLHLCINATAHRHAAALHAAAVSA